MCIEKRILATKVIHNPWFNEKYNKVHRLEEDRIELYNIEVIIESQFTLIDMPKEMNIIKTTTVSVPFSELGFDVEKQVFPTDAYECISYGRHRNLRSVYLQYLKQVYNQGKDQSQWTNRDCETNFNKTHLICSCENTSVIGVKRNAQPWTFLKIFVVVSTLVVLALVLFMVYHIVLLLPNEIDTLKQDRFNFFVD